jgi:hypothetical protein
VIRQESTEDVAQLAGDTHVYTNFAMALARALGFDLCPRLSHLRDRRLHVPAGHTVPEELLSVTDREAIELIWDDFVHLTASVQTGHCSVVQALMRFGSAARGQPLYDGGVCLGQLQRSIFLIDFFTIQLFRGGNAARAESRRGGACRRACDPPRKNPGRTHETPSFVDGRFFGRDAADQRRHGVEHDAHATGG